MITVISQINLLKMTPIVSVPSWKMTMISNCLEVRYDCLIWRESPTVSPKIYLFIVVLPMWTYLILFIICIVFHCITIPHYNTRFSSSHRFSLSQFLFASQEKFNKCSGTCLLWHIFSLFILCVYCHFNVITWQKNWDNWNICSFSCTT